MKKAYMLIIATILVISCSTENHEAKKLVKEIRKARDTFAEHPDSFAKACAVQYPVKTESKDHTYTVSGPVDTIHNTVSADLTYDIVDLLRQAKTDSIRAHIIDSLLKNPVIIKADCPPVYVHHDTVYRERESNGENTAQVTSLTNQVNTLLAAKAVAETNTKMRDATIEQKSKSINTLRFSLILLVIIVILYIGLRIKKIIP